MSDKTVNLGLIKPANGEYFDAWDLPVNANWDLIDLILGGQVTETTDARGTQATLKQRLDVALNSNGTLKDVPEVATARSSSIYDNEDGAGSYTLDLRVEKGDKEVFSARENAADLRASLAFHSDDNVPNSIISAPTGYLTFTGANAKVDGSVTNIVANINGYKQVIRTLKQVTISGAAATYYLYLDRSSTGEIYLDRTGGGQNTGACGVNSLKLNKFTDTTQNFVTLGVQPGDYLEITTTGSPNKYQYVVQSVLGVNDLLIVGTFETAQGALNYKITNPIAPTLGFTATPHAKRFQRETNRIYIGRAVFDGSQITSVASYGVKGRYEEFFSITLLGGDFSVTALHQLGYFPTKVSFFGSQANDYSLALEPLSVAQHNTSGLQRSVIVDMNDTQIRVKNATNGVFYKDYSGSAQTAGYLLIVAER